MGRVGLANRGVQNFQELLVVRAVPLNLSLQNDWWRSHHLGRPLFLADQVRPAVPADRGFLQFLGNPCHPLSRCSPQFLSVLKVHPGRADREVLAFLGILAIQMALLFLLDHKAPEIHRYPSLLCLRLAPQVRGNLEPLAVR